MKSINLGHQHPPMPMPALDSVKTASGEPTKVKPVITYPSLHIEGEDKALRDLHKMPEKGVMHVHYSVHARGIRKTETGGEKHHVELKIHKISHVAPMAKEKSGEEALDSLARDVKGLAPSTDQGDGQGEG
jgi:hypothetical protein